MHPLGEKNKYIAMMFMKMSKEYWALGRDGIAKVSAEHARSLKPYNDMLTQVVCGSFDARYDQVTVVESDTLERIHDAANAFKLGAKGAYMRSTSSSGSRPRRAAPPAAGKPPPDTNSG